MTDKCHLCLLGLIILSSLLTGTSGVNDDHVFISSGKNVRLPCNNHLHDCKSTTWIYDNRFSNSTDELIGLGKKKKDIKRHERLSLGSDCSLNINNITKEDYGFYICQQYVNGQQQGTDARVYLHVLHVSSSSSQTEISAGSSAGVKLTISDSRYQISAPGHCIITLTTTLLNEDDNREWRCEVTHRNQVKTSVTYTVKSSAPVTSTLIPVSRSNSETTSRQTTAAAPAQDPAQTVSRTVVIIVEFAVFAAPTLILLQIICARRAGRKNLQH
ncbi:Contactin-3 [Labeo rohita]|uniref:Contactin-3 n=1 Tax=Labeo rohita TaxID=84645 RepID=A0ABQ8L872_LABRO|nr:Contactin-3 [Labeo rohita]